MPDWADPEPLEEPQQWTPADIREGDLLFGTLPDGMLAWLGGHAGEDWRHVGSVVRDRDGNLVVVEVSGDRFKTRLVSKFLGPRYSRIGCARLGLADECIRQANDWMLKHAHPDGFSLADEEGTPQVYAWPDLIVSGVIAATRRGVLTAHKDKLLPMLAKAVDAATPRLEYKGQVSLTCSAFVYYAFDQAGGSCGIELPRWRSGLLEWPPALPSLEDILDGAPLASMPEASLLDLYWELERRDRQFGNTRIRPGQALDLFGMIGRFVRAIAGETTLTDPRHSHLGGRWTTPGDIWLSRSVRERGIIVR